MKRKKRKRLIIPWRSPVIDDACNLKKKKKNVHCPKIWCCYNTVTCYETTMKFYRVRYWRAILFFLADGVYVDSVFPRLVSRRDYNPIVDLYKKTKRKKEKEGRGKVNYREKQSLGKKDERMNEGKN
ncbi:hypothetical protein K0M31_009327 [Melipona bicolor]|uniref:Uncharacterized protein n=1 Tax=Melipona bicolor TaxID=60889 RepID=A0AA40FPE7_9HYME|nr:hypothetical protein K0M31_009327 [Melipona bicolor]